MPATEPNPIELDGSKWSSVTDLYKAIFAAVQSPPWHGTSPDALNDSMVFGGINGLGPPYDLVITNLNNQEIGQEVDIIREVLTSGRADFRGRHGYDVNVSLRLEGQPPVR